MIIQEQLYKRIEGLINSKRNNPKYNDVRFKLSKSNSSNSIYMTVMTIAKDNHIRIKYRISDHYNSEVKTKVVRRTTNFNFIERKLDLMIKQARSIRYNHLVKSVCKNGSVPEKQNS